jgi:hypothetical protein
MPFVASPDVKPSRTSLIDTVPPIPTLASTRDVQTREMNRAILIGGIRDLFAHGEVITSETGSASIARITNVRRPIVTGYKSTPKVEGTVTSMKFVASWTAATRASSTRGFAAIIVRRKGIGLFREPLPVKPVLHHSCLCNGSEWLHVGTSRTSHALRPTPDMQSSRLYHSVHRSASSVRAAHVLCSELRARRL